MSDIHILEGDDDANEFNVAFHVPVPSEDNSVGVNLQTCVTQDPTAQIHPLVVKGGTNSDVPWISQQEITAMNDGEIVEYQDAFTRTPGETPAQDLVHIKDKWHVVEAKAAEFLRNRYKYWGRDDSRS